MPDRWDETWHRLREWTNGQGPSERLAAQILLHDGYEGMDPSHPLGGKDGVKDATCQKNGQRWIMAVYFPRGQQDFAIVKQKFLSDLAGVAKNGAIGIAFVTNQELRLAERRELQSAAATTQVDLFHLERITAVLDEPTMAAIRKQFLSIDHAEIVGPQPAASINASIVDGSVIVAQNQLGGQVAHNIVNVGSQPRRVSNETLALLVEQLKTHPPEVVDFLVANDGEAKNLAAVIREGLVAAGWTLASDAIALAPSGTGVIVGVLRGEEGKSVWQILGNWIVQAGLHFHGEVLDANKKRAMVYIALNPI